MSDIEAMVHDVNARCSNLRSAVALLRDGKPQLVPELLKILETEHEKLGRVIAEFRDKRVGEALRK